VKPHGRGEPCVWAEELRGWRRSLQDAPRGGKELETVEGREETKRKKHMWATLMETSEPQE